MKPTTLLLIAAGLAAGACAQAQTAAPATPAAPAPAPSDWQATLKSVAGACKEERPEFCPGLSGATALACLQKNIDKLHPNCKDAVTKAGKSVLNY
jgi:hypothetical protein